MPTKLLYRASRDGFEMSDWQKRCLGKSRTMTLVKVHCIAASLLARHMRKQSLNSFSCVGAQISALLIALACVLLLRSVRRLAGG